MSGVPLVPDIPLALTRRVAERAHYRCEYCHTPQVVTAQTFHVDHIVPRVLGGQTHLHNLCYACPHCNLHKGDRIQAHDPRTGRMVRLFNPRTDHWDEHLRWSATYTRLIPRTAIARATVVVLDLNADIFVNARRMWLVLGLLP